MSRPSRGRRSAAEHAGASVASGSGVPQMATPPLDALRHLPGDLVLVVDGNATITAVGDNVARLLGSDGSRLTGQPLPDVVHPDDRAVVRAALADLTRHPGHDARFRARLAHIDGRWLWLDGVGRDLLQEPGVHACVLTFRDITAALAEQPPDERRRIFGDAQRDSQRLTDIFEATHDLVAITDRRGVVLYLNPAARRFFGLPEHGPLEALRLDQWFPTHLEGGRLPPEVVAGLERDGMWYGELSVTRHDGVVVPVLGQLINHTDDAGRFEFFSGILHDISNRKDYESQLAHQATHDPLTGLMNRTLLQERLAEALDRARRHGKQVAVLFLDLDHFKVVNDSLGHAAGDSLLVAVAGRLRTVVRPGDAVARFGGDEFVIVCEDLDTAADAVAVAERVNHVIAAPMLIEAAEVFVGASIGIAIPDATEGAAADPGALIRDADAAMYRAKERGRSRWELFDASLHVTAIDRLGVENALRRAEERRELRVRYQPIISLHTGQIEGVEALMRWEHAERGLLPPSDFIHVAEETGLIVPMGAWVLEQACRQLGRWRHAHPGLESLRVSVNLSGRQLSDPHLVEQVASVLAAHDIEPGQIELEITESVLMDDVDISVDILNALKGLGVKLVVDDFGTGYSSLSYLRRFPVDLLKVDRSFVDGLGHDASDSAIVTAIVTMAHTLGLRAVAEGVETQHQLDELRAIGCDLAQGYFMARPDRGYEIGELIAAEPRW